MRKKKTKDISSLTAEAVNNETRHAPGTIDTMQKEIATTTTRLELSQLQAFNDKRTNSLKKELNDMKNQVEDLLNSNNDNHRQLHGQNRRHPNNSNNNSSYDGSSHNDSSNNMHYLKPNT